MVKRFSTGNKNLDKILGGGLIKGTKTIIYGAPGTGKSILGVSIAHQGIKEDKYPGLICNSGHSADDQMQINYAKDFFNWKIKSWDKKIINPQENIYCNRSIDMVIFSENQGDGPHSFENDFFILHLPKTKRIVLDDLLSNSNSLRFFNNFLYNYSLADRTEIYPSDNKIWLIMASNEQLKLYSQGKLKNILFGAEELYAKKDSEDDKKYSKIGLRRTERSRGHYGIYTNTYQTWNRKLITSGLIEPNVRIEKHLPKDHSFIFNLTLNSKNIIDIVNGPIINNEADAGVNTIIALGYLPSSEENLYQKSALAILKHRGSDYDKRILSYEITNKGFNIKI